jgi:hypothetical protein
VDLLVAAQKPDEQRRRLKCIAETAEFNPDWLLPIFLGRQIRHGFLADAR